MITQKYLLMYCTCYPPTNLPEFLHCNYYDVIISFAGAQVGRVSAPPPPQRGRCPLPGADSGRVRDRVPEA